MNIHWTPAKSLCPRKNGETGSGRQVILVSPAVSVGGGCCDARHLRWHDRRLLVKSGHTTSSRADTSRIMVSGDHQRARSGACGHGAGKARRAASQEVTVARLSLKPLTGIGCACLASLCIDGPAPRAQQPEPPKESTAPQSEAMRTAWPRQESGPPQGPDNSPDLSGPVSQVDWVASQPPALRPGTRQPHVIGCLRKKSQITSLAEMSCEVRPIAT